MTKNIRKDLKGTGDNGKENKLKKEKHQKKFRKKKKRLNKKGQKLENRQMMMMIKQAIWLTHTMSCKVLGMRNLERGVVS